MTITQVQFVINVILILMVMYGHYKLNYIASDLGFFASNQHNINIKNLATHSYLMLITGNLSLDNYYLTLNDYIKPNASKEEYELFVNLGKKHEEYLNHIKSIKEENISTDTIDNTKGL